MMIGSFSISYQCCWYPATQPPRLILRTPHPWPHSIFHSSLHQPRPLPVPRDSCLHLVPTQKCSHPPLRPARRTLCFRRVGCSPQRIVGYGCRSGPCPRGPSCCCMMCCNRKCCSKTCCSRKCHKTRTHFHHGPDGCFLYFFSQLRYWNRPRRFPGKRGRSV